MPDAATSRHLTFLVDGGAAAPAKARRLVAASVSDFVLEGDLLDDLLLAVSEVVTNSVRHGGAGEGDLVELRLAFDRDRLRIDVCDNGPGFIPALPTPGVGRVGGLGLPLVESLSDRWGVAGSNPTRVWFELRPALSRAASG